MCARSPKSKRSSCLRRIHATGNSQSASLPFLAPQSPYSYILYFRGPAASSCSPEMTSSLSKYVMQQRPTNPQSGIVLLPRWQDSRHTADCPGSSLGLPRLSSHSSSQSVLWSDGSISRKTADQPSRPLSSLTLCRCKQSRLDFYLVRASSKTSSGTFTMLRSNWRRWAP